MVDTGARLTDKPHFRIIIYYVHTDQIIENTGIEPTQLVHIISIIHKINVHQM